jgi:hypothetical protein
MKAKKPAVNPSPTSCQVKGQVNLLDGTTIPEYTETYKLPISTHKPHKWAMIDMESGNIYVMDPNKSPYDPKHLIQVPSDGRNQTNRLLRKILGVPQRQLAPSEIKKMEESRTPVKNRTYTRNKGKLSQS